jgi:hypothetical protein
MIVRNTCQNYLKTTTARRRSYPVMSSGFSSSHCAIRSHRTSARCSSVKTPSRGQSTHSLERKADHCSRGDSRSGSRLRTTRGSSTLGRPATRARRSSCKRPTSLSSARIASYRSRIATSSSVGSARERRARSARSSSAESALKASASRAARSPRSEGFSVARRLSVLSMMMPNNTPRRCASSDRPPSRASSSRRPILRCSPSSSVSEYDADVSRGAQRRHRPRTRSGPAGLCYAKP